MPIIEGTGREGLGLGHGRSSRAYAEYAFAADGGAVGDIVLRGESIPAGAVVTDVLLVVDTVPTSGGLATIAVRVEAAGDAQGAAAISGAPWSTAGAKRGSLTATSAPVRTTATRAITASVGTAALTAGAFRVLVEYVEF